MRSSSESGQSTVEAAILLPVLFAVLGLIAQPALLLYTQSVMSATASECCRLIATCASDEASIRAYMDRRLSAVPSLDIFHVGKDWELEWSTTEAGEAEVKITNHARPLPLLGLTASLTNALDEDGNVLQEARASSSPIPSWTLQQEYAPSDWVQRWK